MSAYNGVSFGGIIFILLFSWLISNNRRVINWRVILWGTGLQLAFAAFVFRLPAGVRLFEWLNNVVIRFLSFSREGIYFLFGPLSLSPGQAGPHGEQSPGFILAIQSLPTIIFFAAFVSLLYHLRVMPFVIGLFSRVFTRLMRISGAESLCTASNIFVGIESAVTVRPYLERMTESELCTILTAGMATIASTVLGLYTSILEGTFPLIAGHLISASILSAPAAIVISKLLYPETEKPETLGQAAGGSYERSPNWISSIIDGANQGVKLLVGVSAVLIAFLGLLALANWLLGTAGDSVGWCFGKTWDVSLEKILCAVFAPFAVAMGVPLEDAYQISWLLGQRTIATEVVSYQGLSELLANEELFHERSAVIAAYALCGFAHISSLAVFVGGISALVPGRAKTIAALGFRALAGATLACLMTGAVAGVFCTEGMRLTLFAGR